MQSALGPCTTTLSYEIVYDTHRSGDLSDKILPSLARDVNCRSACPLSVAVREVLKFFSDQEIAFFCSDHLLQ